VSTATVMPFTTEVLTVMFTGALPSASSSTGGHLAYE
jgi:hypothetical protein